MSSVLWTLDGIELAIESAAIVAETIKDHTSHRLLRSGETVTVSLSPGFTAEKRQPRQSA